MAEALLGLGSTGASGLNQELIDKLKAAERKATVEPIETDIEGIASDIEKFDEVNQAVLGILDAIRPFDWFVTEGVNAFEEKSASTSGDSVIFDAQDVTSLNNGFTTVNVTQIGQKDVFQSNLINDASSYSFNNNITINGTEVNLNSLIDNTTTPPTGLSLSSVVDEINNTTGLSLTSQEQEDGTFNYTLTDSLISESVTFNLSKTATYEDLISKMNTAIEEKIADTGTTTNFTSSVSQETFDFSIGSESFSIVTTGLSYGDLSDKINEIDGVNASVNEVSSGSFRLIMKSDEVGIANSLSFSGNVARDTLGFMSETSNAYEATNTTITSSSEDLILNIDGDEYTIDIAGKSLEEIRDAINLLGDTDSSGAIDNGETAVNISANITSDGRLEIINQGATLDISGTASDTLGLRSNHTLNAQDMKMIVDGVDYEAASNEIVVDGLTITATTLGTSTINIQNDTSYLATQMQSFVDAYNTLAELVSENTQADSEMYNRTGLKAILDQIKEKVLGSYGENQDKSLFNIGFSFDADLSGKLTFDESVFNKALEDDLQGIKDMFIGSTYYTEDNPGGFGTQTKKLLDDMFYSTGAVSLFESSLTKREEKLNDDLEKAQETLDTKYQHLTAQFSMYASVITQFETAFGGLKMMIDQSIASNNN